MKGTSVTRTLHALSFFAVAFLLAARASHAQTNTGSIRGVVTDAQGAGTADVQIVARDLETNIQRAAVTNASGFYFLGGLRPTRYDVSARRLGFAASTRTVRVQVGQTLDVNFQLAQTGVQLSAV